MDSREVWFRCTSVAEMAAVYFLPFAYALTPWLDFAHVLATSTAATCNARGACSYACASTPNRHFGPLLGRQRRICANIQPNVYPPSAVGRIKCGRPMGLMPGQSKSSCKELDYSRA